VLHLLGVLAPACLFALLGAGSAVGVELRSAKKPVGTVTKFKGNVFRINGIPVTSVPATLFKGQRLTTSGTVEVWFSVKYGGSASCDTLPGSVKLRLAPGKPGVLVHFDKGQVACTTPKGKKETFTAAGPTSMTSSDPAFVFSVGKKGVTIRLRRGAAVVSGVHAMGKPMSKAVVLALNPKPGQPRVAKQVVIPFHGDPGKPKPVTLTPPEQAALTVLPTAHVTDYKAPVAKILVKPDDPTPSQNAKFAFTAGSLFACSFDGGPFLACTSPLTKSLPPGRHTFAVQATDPAGNSDPTPTRFSGSIEKNPSAPIVFQSNRTNPTEYQIYTVNPNGGRQAQLTHPPGQSFDPAWSPDGTQIVFESDRNSADRSQLFTMNKDGSKQQQLTTSPASDRVPAWSPDGKKIAFTRTSKGHSQIYILDLASKKAQPLRAGAGDDTNPAWSPDGTKIVFSKHDDAQSAQIDVVKLDGTRSTPLTSPPKGMSDLNPTFSPDGTRIAFERDRVNPKDPATPMAATIYVMDANGTGEKPLTKTEQFEFHPAWSPDGRRIAFAAGNGAATQIVVVDVDGSGQQKPLTSSLHQNIYPNW
jgi:TolB protein